MDVAAQRVTSWPLLPLHEPGFPKDKLEDCQARSHAAFAWRALEELRVAWDNTLRGGRVEMVMLDVAHMRAFLLARKVIETVPFPWPNKTSWYFYWPTRFEPVVVQEQNAKAALAGDRISISQSWVQDMITLAVSAGPRTPKG
jgi:hypothetical protein